MSNEWFERGELPPVGTECEVLNHQFTSNAAWEKCTIIFMGKFKCIYNSESCHERVGSVELTGAIEFRPICTEREKAIDAAINIIKKSKEWTFKEIMAELYDAGSLRLPEDK